jgi:HAD superfamily hydrolase (TIGR01549 family)
MSLDFFGTLATHRAGRSRGALIREYLDRKGWRALRDWDPTVVYDVFAHVMLPTTFTPSDSEHERAIARALFDRLGVLAPDDSSESCAAEIWSILGPEHFELFPDVLPTLQRMRDAGYRVVITSNWHRGLEHFCHGLGLSGLVDGVVASAEVGFAKPDPRIFALACERLGVKPSQALHVGDSNDEDYVGARKAGLSALLLCREAPRAPNSIATLHDVRELSR